MCKEIMDLILKKSSDDDRIRACLLNGSRVVEYATLDQYSDYDIIYVVNNIRSFTNDESWINYFGDILILQKPTDWYNHPYNYSEKESFTYLVQFSDGNRIDLSLVDITHISELNEEKQPRIILLDKDAREELYDVAVGDIYNIRKPSDKEYFDTCNEFWWLSINVAKGICRNELGYVKQMEHYEMEMFHKMLSWKIGIDNNFKISVGKCNKYLKRYLSKEEMERVENLYSCGNMEDIKEKLFAMFYYFEELSEEVSNHFGFEYKGEEARRVRAFVLKMLTDDRICNN